MKRHVLVLHGGNSFATIDRYHTHLVNKPINLEQLKPHQDWKKNLPRVLGENYEVLYPRFPKFNARYSEWKIIFERTLPLLNNEPIIIAHSLGATFLAKYLAENTAQKPIHAAFFVSSPFNQNGEEPFDEDLADFALPHDATHITEQVENVFFYHAIDDPIVPYTNLARFEHELIGPNITFTTLPTGYGHIIDTEFPEIIRDIHKVCEI